MAKKSRAVSRTNNPKFQNDYNHLDIIPKNESQRILQSNLQTDTVVAAIGSAGTGKSYISLLHAAKQIATHKCSRIVLIRPNIPTGRSLGFTPGTIDEKMGVWLMPALTTLTEALGRSVVDCHIRNGNILLQPIETIRGSSFENSIIIVEEAQNLTMDELKAISTRIGEGSQLILTGDTRQTDLKGASGLERFCDMCVKHNVRGFSSVVFTPRDIVRSGIVKELVIAFEKEGV